MVEIVYRTNPEQPFVRPMPEVLVQVSELAHSNRSDPYEALIDTGADATFVGQGIIIELGLELVYESQLATREGTYPVDIYAGDLLLLDEQDSLLFPGVEFVYDTQEDGIILGRNLLNRAYLQLAGIAQNGQIWEHKEQYEQSIHLD